MTFRHCLALAVLLLCGPISHATTGAHAAHSPDDGPELRSNSALIWDETHASVLYSRRPDVAAPIASITKLMTALVVLDGKQALGEALKITKEDVAKGKGVYSRLPVGTTLTRGDFLHLALMASENRAAHVLGLGRSYPGGLKEFVRTMNVKARALGMTHTRFVDPTGLSSDNMASPSDLSKLVIAAAGDATIRAYSTDKSHSVRVGRRQLEFRNTNSLVSKPDWDIRVQKTGYISEAGRCLVMQAMIEGRSVVIILLDSFGKYTRTADARRVKKWLEAKLAQAV